MGSRRPPATSTSVSKRTSSPRAARAQASRNCSCNSCPNDSCTCDLCKLIGIDVALDASCGLGRQTICMNEMGVNLLGSDVDDCRRWGVESEYIGARSVRGWADWAQDDAGSLPQRVHLDLIVTFDDGLVVRFVAQDVPVAP